ncbi:MAG: 16S rRNA (guanine(966)-N(2))-methyltransferase RsmD [Desulfobulbaceae bacterium]|nr:16S rRNA (guanine(966)-N(2))-methyltransferase RsmD [Desulfobulbaceae bacterium]MCK5544037.1 16S rRNA (guanine(966)-N(2))-methyltransferase RsmD [Desulfobulbaceae bacterium]
MRIIAGSAKGRRLFSPETRSKRQLIRPTSDRAREALLSIIGPFVQDASVLDLFAGTGALGLEALSRGARSTLFVDSNQGVTDLINRNIEKCGFSEASIVVKRDLTKGLSFLNKFTPPNGFTLVFLDPPYGKKMGHGVLFELGKGKFINNQCMVIAEDNSGEKFPDEIGILHLHDQRRYGDTGFWLYRVKTNE